jgi:curved DNA-binding protein CbpA
MTDCFALLRELRRPWLDTEALKERFLALSAEAHPDRFHGASDAVRRAQEHRYAEFNAAHQTLRDTRARLLHLLELELGDRPKDIQRLPPGTMDLFVEIGQTCRDTDAFLGQKSDSESPMIRLRRMQSGMEWTDKLMDLQDRVNQRRNELEAELAGLGAQWDAAPPVGDPTRAANLSLDRLEEIYRTMSYVTRWTEQLQERIVTLAAL